MRAESDISVVPLRYSRLMPAKCFKDRALHRGVRGARSRYLPFSTEIDVDVETLIQRCKGEPGG